MLRTEKKNEAFGFSTFLGMADKGNGNMREDNYEVRAQGSTQLHITVVCLSSLMLCLYDLSTYLKIRVSNCEGKDIIMCRRAWVPNTLGSTLGIGLALLVNILTLGHKLRNFHPGKLALIFNTYKPFYCNKFYTTRKLDINLDFDE